MIARKDKAGVVTENVHPLSESRGGPLSVTNIGVDSSSSKSSRTVLPLSNIGFDCCILYCKFIRDKVSNISLSLREFLRATPQRTPVGGGLYLTVYPESSPSTGLRINMIMIPS